MLFSGILCGIWMIGLGYCFIGWLLHGNSICWETNGITWEERATILTVIMGIITSIALIIAWSIYKIMGA